MIVISVQPGEEVIESMTRQLRERGVQQGAVVSLVGGIDACGISNMPKSDAKSDIITELKQPSSSQGPARSRTANLICTVSSAVRGMPP